MNTRYLIPCILCCISILAACNREEDTPLGASSPICFTAGNTDSIPKSYIATDDGSFKTNDAFGIYAFYTKNEGGTSSAYFENEKVTYNGKDWINEELYYWPTAGGNMSFMAYAPFGDKHIDMTNNGNIPPALAFDASEGKTDLLATNAGAFSCDEYIESGDKIPLKFHHILTKVTFKFNNQLNNAGYTMRINYISLTGMFHTKGKIDEDDWGDGTNPPVLEATDTQSKTKYTEFYSYSYDEDKVDLGDYKYNEPKNILSWYLIPQTVKKEMTVEIGIDLYRDGEKVTEGQTPTYVAKATLPATSWKANGHTAYTLSYEPETGIWVSLITQTNGWIEVDNTNTIE